jgi:diguanylate cyclase (GGDEF)-like protein/PAS domain S-box-containing protein
LSTDKYKTGKSSKIKKTSRSSTYNYFDNYIYKLNSEFSGIYRFVPDEPIDIKLSDRILINKILKSGCKYHRTIFPAGNNKIEGEIFSEIFKNTDIKSFLKSFIKNNFICSGFTTLTINKNKRYFFNSFESLVQKDKLAEIFVTQIEVTKGKNENLFQKENQEELFKSLFHSHPEAVVYLDMKGKIIDANPKFTEMFGYTLDEIRNKNINEGIIHPKELKKEGINLDRIALGKGYLNFETIRKTKDGKFLPVSVSGSPLIVDGRQLGIIGMYMDISEKKKMEEKMKKIATHDPLTGLPNRVILVDRFDVAKSRAKRSDKKIALLMLDLYEFKDINDTFGHDVGDKILKRTATRLSDHFREYDTLIRFGGDEFIILIEDISHNSDIISILTKIFFCFERPIVIDEKNVEVKVNIGIAMLPDDSNDLPDLIRKADIAMYNAKTKGPNTFEFYTKEIEVKRKTIQDELRTREKQFETIFEKAPLGILLIDLNIKAFRVNATLLRMLGYEKRELLSRKLITFLANKEENDALFEAMDKVKEGKTNGFTRNLKLITKGGKHIWTKTLFAPVKDLDGKISFFICTMDNMTEIKNAEEKLEESKNMLSRIIESSPVPMGVIDKRHRITHWNSSMEALTGLKKEEMIGTDNQWIPFYESKRPVLADLLVGGVNEKKILEMYKNKIRKSPLIEGAYEGVEFFATPNVKGKWLEFTAASIKDSQGTTISALETIIDITDRKRNETIMSSLYEISKAIFETKDFSGLYRSIHEIVKKLMPADNFYISLYDRETNTISFPYFVDEYDTQPPPQKLGKGATEYVIRTGKSLLADEKAFEELEQEGKVEKLGPSSVSWLGVPLKLEDSVIGIIVVQSYKPNIYYGQEEKDVLEFISREIATSIKRKKSEEKLKELFDLESKGREESENMAKVISALFSKINLSEVLQKILEQVNIIVPYTAANIALLKGITLYNVSSQGYEKYDCREFVEKLAQSVKQLVIADKAIREKKPILIKNTDKEPEWEIFEKTKWIKSHIAVPILLKNKIIGLLRLDCDEPGCFTEKDIEKLKPFANSAAIAINNAKLFKEAKSKTKEKDKK